MQHNGTWSEIWSCKRKHKKTPNHKPSHVCRYKNNSTNLKTAYFSLAGTSVSWIAFLAPVAAGFAVLCLRFLLGAVSMTSGLPRRECLRSGAAKRKKTKVEKNLNMKYYMTILKIIFVFFFIKTSVLLRWSQIWQQLVSKQTDDIEGNSKSPNLNCKDKIPSTSVCSQWRERWAVINQKYTDGLLIPPCRLYSNWRGCLQSPASSTWGQSLSPTEQLRKMCTWHRERTLRVLLTARLCSDSWSTVWTALHTQNKKEVNNFQHSLQPTLERSLLLWSSTVFCNVLVNLLPWTSRQ